MDFIADFHVHSSYSRATSGQMNLENMNKWAQLKGITVVGTGDFTQPSWFKELKSKLEPAEPGLFRLKTRYAKTLHGEVPDTCRAEVRFVLTAEISTIYKKWGRVRKVHSVILAPCFKSAGRLNKILGNTGNIVSDGRPILGLDTKILLQHVIDASPDNVLIPAHVWTPHFSVLGAASGFDSIEECFEDLTSSVFAIETGLSSDPPMNWRLSSLDRFVLVSNSDAHSPSRLGREANIFSCRLSYFEMIEALKQKDKKRFKGTIEMFPQEGKYHYDGHRSCKQCMNPEETLGAYGLCPVCGRKTTKGVMHRIVELADRKDGFSPPSSFGFTSLVSLGGILSDICSKGVNTKTVQNQYMRLLSCYGNELFILKECPVSRLQNECGGLLAPAVENMRQGRVSIKPGYDGEYGVVRTATQLLSKGKN